MSWVFRAHIITDNEIKGINNRLDKLVQNQLHYHGYLQQIDECMTKQYCYTAEYEPVINSFVSNDYNEMEIFDKPTWRTNRGTVSDATVVAMRMIFDCILSRSECFYVFFSYLYIETDITNAKSFFDVLLKQKTVYKCSSTEAQELFAEILDFTGLSHVKTLSCLDDSNTFEHKIICSSGGMLDCLPKMNGCINMHDILFRIVRET